MSQENWRESENKIKRAKSQTMEREREKVLMKIEKGKNANNEEKVYVGDKCHKKSDNQSNAVTQSDLYVAISCSHSLHQLSLTLSLSPLIVFDGI